MALKLVRQSQHAHVLVCRSCGEALSSSSAPGSVGCSGRLKSELESALLSDQSGWLVRVVESSCLDVCPVGAVSVRLVGAEEGGQKSLTWTCDPSSDVAALVEELKAHLIKKR